MYKFEMNYSSVPAKPVPIFYIKLISVLNVAEKFLKYLFFFGLMIFASFVLHTYFHPRFLDGVELPNGKGDFLVSRDGNIIVGNDELGRIQIYTAAGEFVRGFPVAGGGFSISGVTDGILAICPRRSAARIISYSLTGGYFAKQSGDECTYAPNGRQQEHDGHFYRRRIDTILDRIEVQRAGQWQTLIEMPPHLVLWSNPLWGWLIAFVSAIAVAVVRGALSALRRSERFAACFEGSGTVN